jgi:hypothetical protein
MLLYRVGSHKHKASLERCPRDKHSSLLQRLLNYVRKRFNIIWPSVTAIKLFPLSPFLSNIKLECFVLVDIKHSSLLQTLPTYVRKRFNNICPSVIAIKLFPLSLFLPKNKLESFVLVDTFQPN